MKQAIMRPSKNSRLQWSARMALALIGIIPLAFMAQHHFSLSLDYSLIVAMTDEAHWMIKNKLTTEQQSPDFLNYVYVDGLKVVKPEAVNVVR